MLRSSFSRAGEFQSLTLTDDLALRRLLESHGAQVAGSVGVLVRAYASGRLSRDELNSSMTALIDRSTLHLSRAFRLYLSTLLDEIP